MSTTTAPIAPALLEEVVPDDGKRRDTVRAVLKVVRVQADKCRAELADLLTEVCDRRYWANWGFDSFESFVLDECGFSVRKAQVLIKIFRRFRTLGLSSDQIRRFDWSKAELVARVVNSKNVAELLHDLDSLSFRQLEAKIRLIRDPRRIELLEPVAQPSIDWLLPRPDPDHFAVDEGVWSQLCFGTSRGKSILLVGPSGCGKSQLCELVAQAAGTPIEAFNFGAMSEPRGSLIGNTHFDREKGTWFTESRFVRAIRRPGSCILLDEINRAPREAFNILLPLLDHQGYLALDESEDAVVIRRAPGVTFFATANLGLEYTGAEPLDKALADRFAVVINLDFPAKDDERRLLRSRCPGLPENGAHKLVEFAARQRSMARQGDFVGTVSTRALLAAGEQVAAGLPIESALRFTILNRFSSEGGDVSEQAKLQQIFQRLNKK